MEKIRQETNIFAAQPDTTEKIESKEISKVETNYHVPCDELDRKATNDKDLNHLVPDSCVTLESSALSETERYKKKKKKNLQITRISKTDIYDAI